jgi:GNAT superfamily N-acetyltransferase
MVCPMSGTTGPTTVTEEVPNWPSNDLLVVQSSRGRGIGGRLVDAFVQVARLPRYYHHRDFLEYPREPLVRS